MSQLKLFLFGRFEASMEGVGAVHIDARKTQELLCYLVLHRDYPHFREAVAGSLWGDVSTANSKKYMRQALWQLQSTFEAVSPLPQPVLRVDSEWIQINPTADLWVDVTVFERAFSLVRRTIPTDEAHICMQQLQQAVDLCRGDLLEGCYEDWCLFERERLQNMHLTMLETLMSLCEVLHDYDTGLQYGERILRQDRVREPVHQEMMRLYWMAENRSAALRQYERCVAALREELGMSPSTRTVLLYQQIKTDIPTNWTHQSTPFYPLPSSPAAAPELLSQLTHIRETLALVHQEVLAQLESIERALHSQGQY